MLTFVSDGMHPLGAFLSFCKRERVISGIGPPCLAVLRSINLTVGLHLSRNFISMVLSTLGLSLDFARDLVGELGLEGMREAVVGKDISD